MSEPLKHEPTELFDVIVIGAGPAGLSVAAECVYHELGSVILLEKGPTHNQTIHQYYPDDKRVDAEYKGQEAICAGLFCFRDTTKANFLEHIEKLNESYILPILYNINVDSIKKQGDGLFSVSSTDGKLFNGRNVVIAVGRMGKPNRPDFFAKIPATVRKEIRFDIQNLEASGKRILVVGGGNTAVEFALSLAKQALVTLSYRKEEFSRLNPMNLKLLEEDEREKRITILRNSNVEQIDDREGKPFVTFKESDPSTFDCVVFAIGGSSPAAFLQSCGIEIDERKNPKLNNHLETNVENLYVVGELSVPQGKGSIIVSFNSGKKAVDGMMKKLGKAPKPEMVSVSERY